MTYQSPEIMEIGQAEEVTLGFTAQAVPDGCDCTKAGSTGGEVEQIKAG
jgi:hypothetical protein